MTVSAPHFYEAKGLINSQHNADNQWHLSREMLHWVVVIKVVQRIDVPPAEITCASQALPAGRSLSTADWTCLSAQWKEGLTEYIDKLLLLCD